MLLLSIGALTLVGCLERGVLEGNPPRTLQAPTLPTLRPSATPPEPTATTIVVGQLIVSATATSIIPAVTATSVDSSVGVANTGTVSGTAEGIIIPPTRTVIPPTQTLTASEMLTATIQALMALNNPTATLTQSSTSTSTIPTPTIIDPAFATITAIASTIATPTPITTTAVITPAAEVPETEPQPTIPTPTPLPTVPTATPIPIATITPLADKSNLYVVREGETLESIGTDWGVPTLQLASANALPITAILTPGQPIVIPIDQIIVPTPTLIIVTATPTPSATTTSTITSTETTTDTIDTPPPTVDETGEDIPETHSSPPDTPFDPNNHFVHVVQSGETIYRIAIRYGFTEQELIDYNQLEYNSLQDNYLIYPGDELKIPLRP